MKYIFLLLIQCILFQYCAPRLASNTFKGNSFKNQKIFLVNDDSSDTVELKIGRPVDIVTETDSVRSSNKLGYGWELYKIISDTLYVKMKKRSYQSTKYDSINPLKNFGWVDGSQLAGYYAKNYKEEIFEKEYALDDIKIIRFAKRDNYIPQGDFIPAFLIFAIPIAPWKDGKYRWEMCLQLIGGNVAYLCIVYGLLGRQTEFIEYDLTKWHLNYD